jgi:integrase
MPFETKHRHALEQGQADRSQASTADKPSLVDQNPINGRGSHPRPRHVQFGDRQQTSRLCVVSIKVEDVAPNGYTVERATVRQRKTGRPVKFELTEQTRQAIEDYLRASGRKPGEFLFASRRQSGRCMTTRQYARLVAEWIGRIGLDPRLFGTHSLRRTKATLIYRRTGNLRAVQLLLGHTKIESTVRYLGIEVDDALAIAEQVDV